LSQLDESDAESEEATLFLPDSLFQEVKIDWEAL
jgi:hypothetical protein